MSQEDKQAFAKQLFEKRTKAERQFSKRLTQKGVEFEEQVVVGAYIVDFLFRSKNLIIEIDGSVHESYKQMAYDDSRTKQLNKMGFKVVRIWNKQANSCDIDSLIKVQHNKKHAKPKSKYRKWKDASNLLTRSIESKFRVVKKRR